MHLNIIYAPFNAQAWVPNIPGRLGPEFKEPPASFHRETRIKMIIYYVKPLHVPGKSEN